MKKHWTNNNYFYFQCTKEYASLCEIEGLEIIGRLPLERLACRIPMENVGKLLPWLQDAPSLPDPIYNQPNPCPKFEGLETP